MFAKLKKQVKEKSGDAILAASEDSTSAVKNTDNVTSDQHRGRVKSNSNNSVSDENHWSDETSSTNTEANTAAVEAVTTTVENNSNLSNKQSTDLVEKESKQQPVMTNDTSNKTNGNEENSYKYQLQQLNQSLLNQIDLLANELKEKLKENEDLRAITLKLNSQIAEYENEIKVLKNDKDELIIRNAELSEKYELLKHVNAKQQAAQQQQQQHNHHQSNHSLEHHQDTANLSKPRTQSDSIAIKAIGGDDSNQNHQPPSNIPTAAANDAEIKSLRDELNEKNKVIKNLQQRLNDLKKTLQKELKYQQLPNETAPAAIAANVNSSAEETVQARLARVPPPPPPPSSSSPLSLSNGYDMTTTSKTNALKKPIPVTSTASCTDFMLNGSMQAGKKLDEINHKYLKHVIFKFLTSREYEALHLVKAISVLLNFTSDEEKALRESLEWKMSWFGTKPKLTNLA